MFEAQSAIHESLQQYTAYYNNALHSSLSPLILPPHFTQSGAAEMRPVHCDLDPRPPVPLPTIHYGHAQSG